MTTKMCSTQTEIEKQGNFRKNYLFGDYVYYIKDCLKIPLCINIDRDSYEDPAYMFPDRDNFLGWLENNIIMIHDFDKPINTPKQIYETAYNLGSLEPQDSRIIRKGIPDIRFITKESLDVLKKPHKIYSKAHKNRPDRFKFCLTNRTISLHYSKTGLKEIKTKLKIMGYRVFDHKLFMSVIKDLGKNSTYNERVKMYNELLTKEQRFDELIKEV